MPNADDVINSVLTSAVKFLQSIERRPQVYHWHHPDFSFRDLNRSDKVWIERWADNRVCNPLFNIDFVMAAMKNAYDFEARRRDERLRQARLSFNAALVLLIAGTLVVLTGVVLLFRNQNRTAGIVTSAAGVISNFFSAILFKFSRDANDRLDKIKTNLAKIEAYQQTLTAISENRKAASQ